MKVLVDTNVLISAGLNRNSNAAQAFFKATQLPYECVICDYCIDEFKRIAKSKLSTYTAIIDSFLVTALMETQLITTPADDESVSEENDIRDIKDRPIIRAAILAKVDIILTGDKDFLEAKLKKPKMMSPAEFLALKR